MSFTKLNQSDIITSVQSVAAPLWSNGYKDIFSGSLTSSAVLQTTSAEINSSAYYVHAYLNTTPANNQYITPEFSVAFASAKAANTYPINRLVPTITPSLVNHRFYSRLIYGDSKKSSINFGGIAYFQNPNTLQYNSFFAIQIDRSKYKEKLLPGSFNLSMYDQANTSWPLNLTDNSKEANPKYEDCGRVYDVISGFNGTSAGATLWTGYKKGYASFGSYGLFCPDIGLIIINGDIFFASDGGLEMSYACNAPLSMSAALSATTNQFSPSYNNYLFISNTRGPFLNTNQRRFELLSEETISSTVVFCRVGNADYNYSSNPSFLNNATGSLAHLSMIDHPRTYITTVGLYNDNNELLAVAKLSKPIAKDFTTEALIKIKLDW